MDILICRGAESFLDDALPQLKYAMNDRSQDVRMTFYSQLMRSWLTGMEMHALRKYEHHFVLFLINGLSDEIPEISAAAREMLEEHGKNMREALIQLGEENADGEQPMSGVDSA